MKKTLLSIALLGAAFVANSQTSIFKEDFNSYTVGSNLSSDLTGVTPGLGGWITKTDNNGVNTASKIVSVGTNDNGLQFTGYELGTTTPSSTRNVYRSLTSNWAGRPAGQNFFNLEFMMNVDATTTSKNNFTSYVLDGTNQLLMGVRFDYVTRELYGLVYDEVTPATNPKTYNVYPISLGPVSNNAATPLILSSAQQLIKVGLGFNTVDGECYFGVEGITVSSLSGYAYFDSKGLPGKSPAELRFVAIAGAGNTLSAKVVIDDIEIKAQTCTFPVPSEFKYSVNSACIGSGNLSPEKYLPTTAGVFSVTPSTGLTVNASTGVVNTASAVAGNYTIKYVTTMDQNLGQCSDFHTESITIKNCASLDEIVENKFSVYPNPANDVVSVSLSNEFSNGTIRLLSADGKVIESREFNNSTLENFDVKALNSGVYFFQVGNTTEKVIIK